MGKSHGETRERRLARGRRRDAGGGQGVAPLLRDSPCFTCPLLPPLGRSRRQSTVPGTMGTLTFSADPKCWHSLRRAPQPSTRSAPLRQPCSASLHKGADADPPPAGCYRPLHSCSFPSSHKALGVLSTDYVAASPCHNR